MEQVTDLDILVELNKTVNTRIGKFEIRPVQMKKFKRFSALSAPMFNDILAVFEGKKGIDKLIAQHEKSMVELLTLCSDFKEEDYQHDNFYADDFASLVITLVEVNMDFFIQNLLPQVSSQTESLLKKYNKIKNNLDQVKSKP